MLISAHPVIEPQKFLDEDILNKYGKDYMFLTCIEYILQVKTGPFAEHSNQLWGISAVPNWTKINQGLIKMYKNEVVIKIFHSTTFCIILFCKNLTGNNCRSWENFL